MKKKLINTNKLLTDALNNLNKKKTVKYIKLEYIKSFELDYIVQNIEARFPKVGLI